MCEELNCCNLLLNNKIADASVLVDVVEPR